MERKICACTGKRHSASITIRNYKLRTFFIQIEKFAVYDFHSFRAADDVSVKYTLRGLPTSFTHYTNKFISRMNIILMMRSNNNSLFHSPYEFSFIWICSLLLRCSFPFLPIQKKTHLIIWLCTVCNAPSGPS